MANEKLQFDDPPPPPNPPPLLSPQLPKNNDDDDDDDDNDHSRNALYDTVASNSVVMNLNNSADAVQHTNPKNKLGDSITYGLLLILMFYLTMILLVQLYGSPPTTYVYMLDIVVNNTQNIEHGFVTVKMSMVHTSLFVVAAALTAFTVVSRPMWFDENVLLNTTTWFKYTIHSVILVGIIMSTVGILSTTAHFLATFIVMCIFLAPTLIPERGKWVIIPMSFIASFVTYIIVCAAMNAYAVRIYALIRTDGIVMEDGWFGFYLLTFLAAPLTILIVPYTIFCLDLLEPSFKKNQYVIHIITEFMFMCTSLMCATFTTIFKSHV
ncbi:hypothetical protein ElyMa_003965100 [Elysia marginata]|uniref:Uncharacterized protein n=1 Tax=Elysia marginata TaxID=1093978 RepID=A0AAV4FVQ1_9GAST|nr:hypothetical protein ElyMa_003965100 [Elysia marginata]